MEKGVPKASRFGEVLFPLNINWLKLRITSRAILIAFTDASRWIWFMRNSAQSSIFGGNFSDNPKPVSGEKT